MLSWKFTSVVYLYEVEAMQFLSSCLLSEDFKSNNIIKWKEMLLSFDIGCNDIII